MTSTETIVQQYKVKAIRNISKSTYVLRFARNEINFKPGQHINLGLAGSREHREYSIYSGVNEDYMEVLIKEVEDGMVSSDLRALKPGDALSVKGPYGFFLTDAALHINEKLLFIASGTGIAPFHSLVRSQKDLDYKIIHGIRSIEEAYEADHYSEGRYVSCTSRGERGDFKGRITDYLLHSEEEKADKVYLCGNSNMIFDAMDILRAKGYSKDQIFTEVYF